MATVLRVILCAGVFVFALTVAFHDYPGHDHFSFAHELLTKADATEKMDIDPVQDKMKTGYTYPATSGQRVDVPAFVVNALVECALWLRGYGYLSSGLAPPAVPVFAVFSFPAVISLFFFFIILQKTVVFEYTPAYVMRRFPIVLSFEYGIVLKKGENDMQSCMKTAGCPAGGPGVRGILSVQGQMIEEAGS